MLLNAFYKYNEKRNKMVEEYIAFLGEKKKFFNKYPQYLKDKKSLRKCMEKKQID